MSKKEADIYVVKLTSSAEVATATAPKERTIFGIGEEATLTVSPSDVIVSSWNMTKGELVSGQVEGHSGGTATFRALGRAGQATMEARLFTPQITLTIAFDVIEPSGARYNRSDGVNIHDQGVPSSGLYGRYSLLPNTVSFHKVRFNEDHAYCTASGDFAPSNGQDHAKDGVVPRTVNIDNTVDHRDQASITSVVTNNFVNSQCAVYIPLVYQTNYADSKYLPDMMPQIHTSDDVGFSTTNKGDAYSQSYLYDTTSF